MEIKSDFIRGYIDLMILRLLLDTDMYGYDISKVIFEKTDGYEIKEATLYSSLRRLEKQGSIESYYSEQTRGGSRRRYYHITDFGREQFIKYCDEWEKTRKIVEVFTGGVDNGNL